MDTNLYEKRNRVDYFQMNTFTKGMNTDTSDAYMPTDQYRYAENLRVTSEENNIGEICLVNGTQLLYPELNDNPIVGKILDINCIKNICTIIRVITNYVDTDDNNNVKPAWYIDVYDYDTNKITTIAGPFLTPIWDNLPTKEKVLSTTLIWESDDNIKLYIADGIHETMSIRIKKKKIELNPGYQFEHIDGTFDLVFSYSKVLLPPLLISVSSKSGTIEGVKVQYAYVLYQKYGNKTKLSQLSEWLSLYDTNNKGFRKSETSKAVDVTIPAISNTTLNYIKIYRIAYISAGLQPKVDIIVDQPISNNQYVYTDSGRNIESVSTEEFISQLGLDVVPKLLEYKNNYLFVANVKYSQDKINELFDNFDTRCFSTGDYVIVDNTNRYFLNSGDVDYFSGFGIDSIKNKLLDDGEFEWDSSSWKANSTSAIGAPNSYNGIGKWLKWRYIFENPSYTSSQSIDNTYMRNEVYRFGIRLFDSNGRASSVKWIADIKMPNLGYGQSPYDNYLRQKVKIEFTPINTDIQNSLWSKVSRYEIVQCPRTTDDRIGLTQGIVGYPVSAGDTWMCAPYYLSLDNFAITSWNNSYENNNFYHGDKSHILFASPEVSYQQDDIYQLLRTGSYKILPLGFYYFNSEKLPLTINVNGDSTTTTGFVLGHDGSSYKMRLLFRGSDYMIYGGGMIESSYNYETHSSETILGSNFSGYHIYTSELTPLNRALTDPQPHNCWEGITIPLENREGDNLSIDSVSKIESEDHWNFSDSNWLTIQNHSTAISGGKTYYNWTNPCILYHALGNDLSDMQEPIQNYLKDVNGNNNYSWSTDYTVSLLRVPIAAGGKYIMLKTVDNFMANRVNDESLQGWHYEYPLVSEGNNSPIVYDENDNIVRLAPVRATLCLIYKSGVTPYGGRNKFSIDRSSYISAGITETSNNSCIADNGDGYISLFTFNHLHAAYNATLHDMNSMRVVYKIPIESYIDIKGQSSNYLYTLESWDYILDTATAINNFTQAEDLYLYNTAYSVNPDIITYSSLDEDNKENQYNNRVHYSQPKINNEYIDNWTIFKPVDFLDVDTRYGEITGLKLFKDKLLFIQDKAAGVLSVNDRTIINDSNNNSIILGTAGVLQRYDYITTLYGMKPDQKAYTISDDALYWWDGYSKEIMLYIEGYTTNQLQHQKYVNSYILSKNESNTPTVFYDKQNKEVVFNVVGNESIVYNEKINAFSSIYTFTPIYHCDLIKSLIVIGPNSNSLYKYGESSGTTSKFFENNANPDLQYVVNKEPIYNKVFDIQTFGGRFYGGNHSDENDVLENLLFIYKTPLKQESRTKGSKDVVTNIEYDFRLAIPRAGYETVTIENEGQENEQRISTWNTNNYGDRMRGKTMQCELKSSSNNLDFSLQYIITKFRTSWT